MLVPLTCPSNEMRSSTTDKERNERREGQRGQGSQWSAVDVVAASASFGPRARETPSVLHREQSWSVHVLGGVAERSLGPGVIEWHTHDRHASWSRSKRTRNTNDAEGTRHGSVAPVNGAPRGSSHELLRFRSATLEIEFHRYRWNKIGADDRNDPPEDYLRPGVRWRIMIRDKGTMQ